MIAEIKAKVDQLAAGAPLANGDYEHLRMNKMGGLYTASLIEQLILSGRVFTLDLGAVGTPLTGNAALDADQPEVVVGCDSGWFIPLEINIDVHTDDSDAYDDVVDIDFIMDRSQCQAAGATATVEVPNNLLDGGDAFSGRAYSIVTGNITAPVASDILASLHWELTQAAAETGGDATKVLGLHKLLVPRFIAGPCQMIGYVTGTNTPTFMGSIIFGHIPASWVGAS